MQADTFIKFLSKRNRDFIDQITSESGLTLYDRDEDRPEGQKKCILISFDPPLAYPPFVFNWNESEVIFFKDPVLDQKFYREVEKALKDVEFSYIVFIEKNDPPHLRKINRWIKSFKDTVYRNQPLSDFPEFILAEYKRPLTIMNISRLKVDS